MSPLWSPCSLWLKSRTGSESAASWPGGAWRSFWLCLCSWQAVSLRGRKAGGWAPPSVLTSSSGCTRKTASPSVSISCSCSSIPPLPSHFYSCHFPSLTLLRLLYSPSVSPIFSPSPFCFSLLTPQVHSSILAIPLSSQSLSPLGLPSSLFLVPSSSCFFSPPAPHTGVFSPGCHQWRNQRQLLHHVSGWLSGCYASHLCEW